MDGGQKGTKGTNKTETMNMREDPLIDARQLILHDREPKHGSKIR